MAADQAPRGPFQAEAEVLAHPDVQAVFEAAHESNRRGVLGEGAEAILLAACTDTGIDPGQYGARMIRWLADFGSLACEVFADLIIRAAHGRPGPHSVTFDLIDGNNTLFVLTEALKAFQGEQGELAIRSNDPSRYAWEGRATDMLAQVNAAMQEDQ